MIRSRFPLCSLCNEPVDLTTAKVDEDGNAIHEECYVLRMQKKEPPPTENPSNESSL
jgi:hypothetical protein